MSKNQFDLAPKNVSITRYLLFFGVSFALLFSALGASGSYGSKVQSFFVWIPTIFLAIFFVTLSRYILTIFLKEDSWLLCFVEALIGSIFFAPFAYFIDVFLLVDPGPYFSLTGIADEFLNVFPPILVSWILVRAPQRLGLLVPGVMTRSLDNAIRSTKTDERGDSSLGSLIGKVPKELGADFIYIKAEKQYVYVVTTKGSALVHCGFNQAIESFPLDYGIKLHRSFWVARKHIHKIDKQTRNVTLSTGLTLPISRRVLSGLKDETPSASEQQSTILQLSES
jgi:hypothetical protein